MDGAALGMIKAGCVRRMAGYGTVMSLFEGCGTHLGYCEGVVDRQDEPDGHGAAVVEVGERGRGILRR